MRISCRRGGCSLWGLLCAHHSAGLLLHAACSQLLQLGTALPLFALLSIGAGLGVRAALPVSGVAEDVVELNMQSNIFFS